MSDNVAGVLRLAIVAATIVLVVWISTRCRRRDGELRRTGDRSVEAGAEDGPRLTEQEPMHGRSPL